MNNNSFKIDIGEGVYQKIRSVQAAENNPNLILRIKVEGGGCSGFSYKYEITTVILEQDYVACKDETKVVIDPTSQKFLNNCKVDYIEELEKTYFKIINPAAQFKCGCGKSFSA